MLSNSPRYPKSIRVYIALTTFLFACFNVLLKAPRLTFDLVSLNWAFSSYISTFPAILSDNMSISNVSSCVLVK